MSHGSDGCVWTAASRVQERGIAQQIRVITPDPLGNGILASKMLAVPARTQGRIGTSGNLGGTLPKDTSLGECP